MRYALTIWFATLCLLTPASGVAAQDAPGGEPDGSAPAADTSLAPSAAEAEPEPEPESDHERHRHFPRLFYIELDAGYNWVHLTAIKQNNFLPSGTSRSDHGFALGGGLGLFVGPFTVGAQVEYAFHSNFNLGKAVLDAGIRFRTQHIQPYFRIGGGYAWVSKPAVNGVELSRVHGGVIDLGAGFEFKITDLLAIGAGGDFAFFFMRRGGLRGGVTADGIDHALEGTAVGYQVSVLGNISLHF